MVLPTTFSIKKMSDSSKLNNDLKVEKDWYEVIDGQQRLTTIFLLTHYINQMWKGMFKLNEFSLSYQTRKSSTEFLNNLRIDISSDKDIIN